MSHLPWAAASGGLRRVYTRPPIITGLRALAGVRQRWHHGRLLHAAAAMAAAPVAGGGCDDASNLHARQPGSACEAGGPRAALRALAPQRRPLDAGAAGVIGIGHDTWECQGLWPSFAQVCDFRRISLDQLRWQAGLAESGRDTRAGLAPLLLARVDALLAERPASLVFIYTDSQYLAPALLTGLRARRLWTVVLGLDDKHRFFARRERGMWVGQETLIGKVDLLWTVWPAAARLVGARGGAAWYAPEAADPAFHVAHDPCGPRDIPALFLGQAYGGRGALVRGLRRAGVAVHAAGHGWPGGHLPFAAAQALVGRSEVVLGCGGSGCMPEVQGLKGRDFEMPMCGAAYLTRYNAELAEHFVVGREILCYSTIGECAEIIATLRAHPARAVALRRAAARRARRAHTWTRRLRQLLALFPDGERAGRGGV